ncbi:MAG TPA: molybdate ABC transporter permease subunit [Blastocatellia bacterium]|nr:molybdate ABC transporter permease subunit [Blastocatellia bacterium]
MNWHSVTLSLQVTAVATLLLFVIGLALAYLLARRRVPGQIVLETLINLPLVLPPSVIGYYLLLALGRGSPLFEWLDVRLVFTWKAAVIASTVVGLPLMVQTARAAIASVDPALEQAARTLGSSELEILWRVTLPLARRGIIAGLILGSARALGEFGATLMVAGNIPDQTQTLPLAIYDAVQSRQYQLAGQMVLIMTALGFAGLWWARRLEQNPDRRSARQTG